MCGIVGYIGSNEAVEFLLSGLRRLEYRGYDSAGVATLRPNGEITTVKTVGRIDCLSDKLEEDPARGNVGIGHTRWATHGAATWGNAHPQASEDGKVVLVHNGVIENYHVLRERLEEKGYTFSSDTDTEIIAQLFADTLKRMEPVEDIEATGYQPLVDALRQTLAQLVGTFGLAILLQDYPKVVLAARRGSPLIVGVGQNEHYVASDTSPLVGRTDKIVYLADHEIAVITPNSLRIIHRDEGHIRHQVQTIELESVDVDLDGFRHYMLKEIFEQPQTVEAAIRGRLDHDAATAKLGGLTLSPNQMGDVRRLLMTACGTSWHAALVSEYQIESVARLPVEVDYASELRYRNPPVDRRTLVFAITQSGETADTLAALREMKRKGLPVLGICNVVGSTIANEADGGIYLRAGSEIGVASTKAFTSQCTVTALLALYFGRLHHLSYEAGLRMIDELLELPGKVAQALESNDRVKRIAEKYADCDNFLYLGRQANFPVALEGALKLKEISYIHAEGYPAAEMKHGPIALVDGKTPSVFLLPSGPVYDKVMANVQEIKARGGPVIAVVEEGDNKASRLVDDVIEIPRVREFLQPVVSIVPLQLLAYHIAVLRGCDVDKPRNLAKSVTVE